jgi:hypothetical protein
LKIRPSSNKAELTKLLPELLPELKLAGDQWGDLLRSVVTAGDKDGNGSLDFEECVDGSFARAAICSFFVCSGA